jgi:hypothetical protein
MMEWLAKRAVEAVVMAVFVGSVVLALLAISGEFGDMERMHTKKYPDHIMRAK